LEKEANAAFQANKILELINKASTNSIQKRELTGNSNDNWFYNFKWHLTSYYVTCYTDAAFK